MNPNGGNSAFGRPPPTVRSRVMWKFLLAGRRRRKMWFLAHSTGGAIETGAEIDCRRLYRVEKIVERRLNRIESLRRPRRYRLGMRLLLDPLLGVGLDSLHTRETLVGSEDCGLARLEPDVSQHRGAVVIGVRDVVLQVGLAHRLHGLRRRHPWT